MGSVDVGKLKRAALPAVAFAVAWLVVTMLVGGDVGFALAGAVPGGIVLFAGNLMRMRWQSRGD